MQRRLPAARPASSLPAFSSCSTTPWLLQFTNTLFQDVCVSSSETVAGYSFFSVFSLSASSLPCLLLLWCPGLPTVRLRTLTNCCTFSESFWHPQRPFRTGPNLPPLPPPRSAHRHPPFTCKFRGACGLPGGPATGLRLSASVRMCPIPCPPR